MAARETVANLQSAARERVAARQHFTAEDKKLTIAEILRLGAASAVNASTCEQVLSVLAKLSLCRTHTLGGREYQCNDCGEKSSRYNSCGDRHCPQCSGSKRVDFNDKASKLLLSGVVYYQVVFTLPSDLSELSLGNRYEMADLLSGSAWKSLSKSIQSEQDYEAAAIGVLHTWNQKLDAHWHVHLLVPGEGPSLSTNDWKQAEAPAEARNSDGYYLVDVDRLRASFRKQAIAKLRRLRRDGKLKFGGKFEYLRSDENWEVFVKNLESKNWVANIQPPPTATSSAGGVVNYLTRYLTGGPISNQRITAADRNEVTFMAREGKRVGGERQQVPITLSLSEFVRRWCLHVQPQQLTKTRYFGGWSNSRYAAYMSGCVELLRSLDRITKTDCERSDIIEVTEGPANEAAYECPHCGSEDLV